MNSRLMNLLPSPVLNASGCPNAEARELTQPCPELTEEMAQVGFGVLARACLRGRNGDEGGLERAIDASVSERNTSGAAIDWRFTTRALGGNSTASTHAFLDSTQH